jgi:tRNA1(Val) A37 N6-methylase TrmN6
MTLMFQRIARNYAKNGYYPTDAVTTERILNALSPCKKGIMRIADPCAGEGSALAECKHHLGSEFVESFAVEYDQERAKQARKLVERCIHSDFQDTIITPRSFGLLWLNPPYGDLVTDKAQTGTQFETTGRKRLEKLFYQHSARLLQYGGVLVLIVPHYSMDQEFRKWLAAGFERVRIFLAPEHEFKQAVVFGIKKRTNAKDEKSRQVLKELEQFCESDDKPELPETWYEEPYVVPTGLQQEIRFNTLKVDETQLSEQVNQYPCLWDQFGIHLKLASGSKRRPLMKLSDWHLALALSAGEVSGVVHSNDGSKTYVIKGDTFKDKKNSVKVEESGNGEFSETRTSIDVFVPVIKALDFTPDSPTFGQVLTIK